uniref:U3 small nucleolar RNA-associated protein 6 homolog C-terminal domain-containing protein n=1 Tax=Pygocentrus nattereri TaxID=42514 RepID=A0AAR2LA90_PYGNA
MADYVQQRLEDRIPGLEQLERVGLFTRKERIGYQFKREDIEFPIISRVTSVFRRATTKWQEDVQLWLSHVAFSKKWGTKAQLSKVFSSMLAIHPDKPSLWIMAAKCEMEDLDSSESARHLFLRALRFHPENKKVYQEYFRMELMHAEKLRKQQHELELAKIDLGEYEFSPEILSGKLAEVVYRDAKQKIKGAEFMLSLLNIAAIFDFTKELQDTILQDLQKEHTDDSVTWDFMARRELEAAGAPELRSAQGRASDTNRREERCCAVYEEGLRSLNTEPMWTCYLTFCLDRFKRKTNFAELKQKVSLQVLLSSGETESAAQVAIAATKRFSQSLETWNLSLQTLVHLERAEAGLLFQEALKNVNPKDSLSLWQLQAEWNMVSQTPEETEALFQVRAAADLIPAISAALKETYLEWAYKTSGYKKARKIFKSLHEHRPFTKAFFTKMIQIEKEQVSFKTVFNLRDYYERALREFGSSDDDLWMGYIREELGAHGSPENCGKLHWRAIKSLVGESVERFTTQYTLMQTGHI